MSDSSATRKRCGCLLAVVVVCLCGVLSLVLALFLIDVLNLGGKVKAGLKDFIGADARHAEPPSPEPEVRVVEKIVEVPVEKVVEKIVEVEVQPPMPSSYIPWQKIDTAKLWNGIQIENRVEAAQGGLASVEREKDESNQLEMPLSFKIPRPSENMEDLERLNGHLPKMLPGIGEMMETAKVSPFFHQLYENKTRRIQQRVTRLDQQLSVHNLYDTETILELEHPETGRKALLLQGEMDVVSDGSDGDRWPFLDNYISMSQFYQPFTSYGWGKRTSTPNPLLARWEENLDKYEDRFAIKGLSIEENRYLREQISTLTREISDMKARSYLIAEADPFIVISLAFLGRRDQTDFGPLIGDYAVVIHEDKLYPAIVGDAGPTWKSGEASLRIAREINKNASPYSRPVSDLTVTYLVFPNSREEVNSPPDLQRWHDNCRAYLDQIGGIGEGYALHQWEDLIPIKLEEWKRANGIDLPGEESEESDGDSPADEEGGEAEQTGETAA